MDEMRCELTAKGRCSGQHGGRVKDWCFEFYGRGTLRVTGPLVMNAKRGFMFPRGRAWRPGEFVFVGPRAFIVRSHIHPIDVFTLELPYARPPRLLTLAAFTARLFSGCRITMKVNPNA
jgi:hypothetical protein